METQIDLLCHIADPISGMFPLSYSELSSMDGRIERMTDLKRRSIKSALLFFLICTTSCAASKASIVQSYEEALKLPDLIIAIPRDRDSKPVWNQALLTTTSATWCEKGKGVQLPDGNEWKNANGFFCLESPNGNNWGFQEIKRKNPGWTFRWNCTSDEPACVIKNKRSNEKK